MSPRGGSAKGRLVVGPSASQRQRRGAGPMTTKGVERRTEILTVARQVFEERGYADTRVADIVAKAEVAQGTFYTYFDSKEAVFTEIARSVTGEMLEILVAERASGSPRDRVRFGLHRFIEAFRPNAVFMGLLEQVGTYTPEMADMRLSLREAFVERSASGIRHMQREGVADTSVDPVLTAEVLGAMVDQTCYIWLSLGKEFADGEVLEVLTSVWARAIGLTEG
ncbi:TetR/AcrR family transcriptional regulator [Aeromicrobium alkaliterrae]|uniref:TetR/AcrR family transcriptional regulator n=1 Tax=Aeromicrobium alkaliterrae TaxID=302168 RepID=A0ABP4W3P2_9ACTN